MSRASTTRRLPVAFISATKEDLETCRTAARDAAIRAGFYPVMMEYWAAGTGNPPVEKCLKEVDGADVVIAIVAHRYGWIPDGQAEGQRKSITWMECERALSEKEVLRSSSTILHGRTI